MNYSKHDGDDCVIKRFEDKECFVTYSNFMHEKIDLFLDGVPYATHIHLPDLTCDIDNGINPMSSSVKLKGGWIPWKNWTDGFVLNGRIPSSEKELIPVFRDLIHWLHVFHVAGYYSGRLRDENNGIYVKDNRAIIVTDRKLSSDLGGKKKMIWNDMHGFKNLVTSWMINGDNGKPEGYDLFLALFKMEFALDSKDVVAISFYLWKFPFFWSDQDCRKYIDFLSVILRTVNKANLLKGDKSLVNWHLKLNLPGPTYKDSMLLNNPSRYEENFLNQKRGWIGATFPLFTIFRDEKDANRHNYVTSPNFTFKFLRNSLYHYDETVKRGLEIDAVAGVLRQSLEVGHLFPKIYVALIKEFGGGRSRLHQWLIKPTGVLGGINIKSYYERLKACFMDE